MYRQLKSLAPVATPKDVNYKYTNKIGTIEQNLPDGTV